MSRLHVCIEPSSQNEDSDSDDQESDTSDSEQSEDELQAEVVTEDFSDLLIELELLETSFLHILY